jgi:glycosyltransferase involved in cell wall biosynthesis
MNVSVLLPVMHLSDYHRELTRSCVARMRENTGVPFELVIVETASGDAAHLADVYVHREERTNIVTDMNIGLEEASGDFVVHTGNDILVHDGWLEALIEPWGAMEHCGATTLGSLELGHRPEARIEEGIYGPIMMFPAKYRFDRDYENIFSDTDLIMRIYRSGKRMFRNFRSVVRHLNQATYRVAYTQSERAEQWARGKQTFAAKHAGCGLSMFRMLYDGSG